jgi:hypothetical protein
MIWIGLIGLSIETVKDICEQGNEPLGSIKGWGKFLSDCKVSGFSRKAQLISE